MFAIALLQTATKKGNLLKLAVTLKFSIGKA